MINDVGIFALKKETGSNYILGRYPKEQAISPNGFAFFNGAISRREIMENETPEFSS